MVPRAPWGVARAFRVTRATLSAHFTRSAPRDCSTLAPGDAGPSSHLCSSWSSALGPRSVRLHVSAAALSGQTLLSRPLDPDAHHLQSAFTVASPLVQPQPLPGEGHSPRVLGHPWLLSRAPATSVDFSEVQPSGAGCLPWVVLPGCRGVVDNIYLLGLTPEACGFRSMCSGPKTRTPIAAPNPCPSFLWAPRRPPPCSPPCSHQISLTPQREQQESSVDPILPGVDESVGPSGPQAWQDRWSQDPSSKVLEPRRLPRVSMGGTFCAENVKSHLSGTARGRISRGLPNSPLHWELRYLCGVS